MLVHPFPVYWLISYFIVMAPDVTIRFIRIVAMVTAPLHIYIIDPWKLWYNLAKESQRAKTAYPPPLEGLTLQSSERRADHGYIC